MTIRQHHRPTDDRLQAAELHESAYLQYFNDVCERRDRAICNPVSTFEAVGGELGQFDPTALPAGGAARPGAEVADSARSGPRRG